MIILKCIDRVKYFVQRLFKHYKFSDVSYNIHVYIHQHIVYLRNVIKLKAKLYFLINYDLDYFVVVIA